MTPARIDPNTGIDPRLSGRSFDSRRVLAGSLAATVSISEVGRNGMTRHGKNCTAGAVYTYHEKRKDTGEQQVGSVGDRAMD